jgi:hypothetical protein
MREAHAHGGVFDEVLAFVFFFIGEVDALAALEVQLIDNVVVGLFGLVPIIVVVVIVFDDLFFHDFLFDDVIVTTVKAPSASVATTAVVVTIASAVAVASSPTTRSSAATQPSALAAALTLAVAVAVQKPSTSSRFFPVHSSVLFIGSRLRRRRRAPQQRVVRGAIVFRHFSS